MAAADARTEYLIDMLENGRSYRVRVQAATTLGKLRSKDAVPALRQALSDENELVIISVATALSQIGDGSCIPDLEKVARTAESEAVKSQVEASLRILKALDQTQKSSTSTTVDNTPRFLIRVDPMGNSSGVAWDGILESFREIVIERVKKEPGVVLQADGLSSSEVKNKKKKEKLAGFVLSGSLIKMEKTGGEIAIKVGLNVFTNPEYSLLMMPTVGGTLSTTPTDEEKVAYLKAIAGVVDRLVNNVFNKLRQMDAP
jgi:hypothetical protein